MSVQVGKFLSLLSDEDREKFLAFAREPARKIDQLMTWLCADGGCYDSKKAPGHPRRVSRTNVWRWFNQWRQTDQVRAAAEFATALHTASAEYGTPDIAGAINLQVAQKLMDMLTRIKNPDPKTLSTASLTLNRIATSQRHVNELKKRQAEAIKAAEDQQKTGASTADVINTFKQALLGVKA